MTTSHLARRSLIVGAGASALAAGATVVPATAASASTSSSRNGLLGAWLIVHTDNTDPTPLRAVVGIAAGGVLSTTEIDQPGPSGLGAWEHTRGHSFKGVFWEGTTDPTDPTAVAQIRIRVRGQWRGDRISGTFHGDIFNGATKLGSFDGTFHGHRLEA